MVLLAEHGRQVRKLIMFGPKQLLNNKTLCTLKQSGSLYIAQTARKTYVIINV